MSHRLCRATASSADGIVGWEGLVAQTIVAESCLEGESPAVHGDAFTVCDESV